MNYAPRSFRELSALKDILYGGDESPTVKDAADGSKDAEQHSSRRDHLTDKLLERLFSAALPAVGSDGAGSEAANAAIALRLQDQRDRPAFSVPVMARNFSRLNARIGVVFRLQYRIIRILQWRRPTHTISALVVYSFVCLHPYILAILPIAAILLGVMVPAYVQRHPPPPSPLPAFPVPAEGPPLAEAAELKPVPELSRDFLMNMRDIQNTMDDFTRSYDKLVGRFSKPTNFKDEAFSSAVFLVLLLAGVLIFILAPIIPWRFVLLVSGWFVVSMGHPRARRIVKSSHQTYISPREEKLGGMFQALVGKDIVLDETPETRHVEIFELQRRNNTEVDEWDDWLFSSSPYSTNSPARVARQRPQGVRYLDEVLAPPGWQFTSDSAWKMDLRPMDWVAQRALIRVDVDADAKWVYDVAEDDNDGGRGEWRRRRWVRSCQRQPAGEMRV
ncbi:integral peroxisomal membrane peroxin-domain-containing protein [Limtongia smithiae]|uniref:integral peroxisomal membrane peroxin-domain-containing protein n=1 Tax=Limtongia smithiae TaxID=1125753 RepID=UPI0034CD126F